MGDLQYGTISTKLLSKFQYLQKCTSFSTSTEHSHSTMTTGVAPKCPEVPLYYIIKHVLLSCIERAIVSFICLQTKLFSCNTTVFTFANSVTNNNEHCEVD